MSQYALFDLPAPIVDPKHPAEYSNELLTYLAIMLKGSRRVLDPFAGKGRQLDSIRLFLPGTSFYGIELEPEWGRCTPWVQQGNALDLPFPDGYFDAICTSPVYGNRTSDHHNARESSYRGTYKHALGRDPQPASSGVLFFGRPSGKYEAFHVKAWTEATRVLCPGGRFVLNIKDFFETKRKLGRVLQCPTDWHITTLTGLGLTFVKRRDVKVRSNRRGKNGDVRMDFESVILFRKEIASSMI